MTAKRDLKRRIRARQARTGESYTSARRRVLAAGGEDVKGATQPTSGTPIDVEEVVDVSETAAAHGFACKVSMFATVAEVVDPAHALVSVRAALSAIEPGVQGALRDLVLHGVVARPRRRASRDSLFIELALAGVTSVSVDGSALAMRVQGRTQPVIIIAYVWRATDIVMLGRHDDLPSRLVVTPAGAFQLLPTSQPILFLIFAGRRYPIRREPFVIGRHPSTDLQIRDGLVSRKHAAVLWRDGAHHLVDLGSHAGVEWRGVKIESKCIEEGDLFGLAGYVVRFTFLETDA